MLAEKSALRRFDKIEEILYDLLMNAKVINSEQEYKEVKIGDLVFFKGLTEKIGKIIGIDGNTLTLRHETETRISYFAKHISDCWTV